MTGHKNCGSHLLLDYDRCLNNFSKYQFGTAILPGVCVARGCWRRWKGEAGGNRPDRQVGKESGEIRGPERWRSGQSTSW